jgi:hypothetical protein
MPSCITCGAYTKFERGLCYDCYQDKNDGIEKSPGMSDREHNYRFNIIKGRIAETLIQELFLTLGYNVFRYGMENTIPAIMTLLKGVKTEVASEIKSMPDFVVQNPQNNEVYFVEVKFRANGTLTRKDLPKDYAWGNAYFVIVSKKHIKCISFEELDRGLEITPSSKNYLGNRKEFDLDKETIIEFCDFALTFFQGV